MDALFSQMSFLKGHGPIEESIKRAYLLSRISRLNLLNKGERQTEPSSIEVQNILKNLNYPLKKKELIQQALKHGASCEVIESLKNIQDRGYTRASDVTSEFKGRFRIWG